MSGSHLSKDFFDLVKSIGESRSKQEEDKIVAHEVHVLKDKMATKGLASKKMKEYLIRMIYVEMLGHDATFGHIHAIKLVSEKKLLEKRVGYLAVSLVLHPNHAFMLLLVNSLQIDLRSDNFLEVSMALTVVCKMASPETVPALLPLVVNILEHKQANIRKKAVMALTRFHQIDSNCMFPLMDKIRKVLCDKDPSVMAASLCLFQSLAMNGAAQLKDLVPSFVSILKQVTEHRLPRDYDYHRMPCPWIQLHLLQLLAILGSADKQTSEGMYEILHEVMKRADIGINVGYAIVYECVKTVTQIYPDQSLIETAALSISRFITSDNHNLKYLGVNSLAAIVQLNSKYAAEHQLLVIDCLEDPDETLRRKTLDLLYSMTNANNVVVIVQKLINYLESTTDVYLRTDLVGRINQLSEKFSPTTWWYVETCANLFELAGPLVKPEVAHNLMRLISESEEMVVEQSGQETGLKIYAVHVFLNLLTKPSLPDILVQVIVWTLGEFGHLSPRSNEIAAVLLQTLDKHYDAPETRCWVLSAITKLSALLPSVIPTVRDASTKYRESLSVDLQQRAHEYLELSKNPSAMAKVLPAQGGAEIRVDKELSFLNNYVSSEARTKPAYNPHREQKDVSVPLFKKETAALKYEAYAKPETQVTPMNEWSEPSANISHVPTTATLNVSHAPAGLNSSKKVVWGPTMQEEAPAPTPIHSTPSTTSAHSEYSAHSIYSQPAAQEPKKAFPKKEEAPKVLTEKEKMAAALFGGGPAVPKAKAAVTSTVRPVTSRPTTATAPVVSKPAGNATSNILDLDILGGSSTPSVQPARTVAPANNDLEDLLGNVFGPTVHAPSSNSFTNQPQQSLNQSQAARPAAVQFDPFEALTKPVSTPAPTTFGNDLDIFGLGGPVVSTPAAPSAPLGVAGMSANMRGRLASFKQSPEQVLASNQSLHISSIKAFMPDRTLVVLCLTNKTSRSFQNVIIQLAPPAGLILAFDGEPAPQVQGNSLVISSSPAQGTSTLIVSVQVRDQSWSGQPLNGQVTCSGLSNLPFSQPLDLMELRR